MSIVKALDLSNLSQSGKILASSLELSKSLVVQGSKPIDIDREVEKFIILNDAIPSFKGYRNYPFSTCISINSQAVHGLPSSSPLEEGDVVKMDIGVSYRGHCTDAARTFVVGTPSDKMLRMLSSAGKALNDGISQAYSGNHVGDISFAIYKNIFMNGYKTPTRLGGHGIGTSPHQPPFIPNFGVKGSGAELIRGMCLAIEPILIDGPNIVELSADGWCFYSPGGHMVVHVEDTVVINDLAPFILTRETLRGGTI